MNLLAQSILSTNMQSEFFEPMETLNVPETWEVAALLNAVGGKKELIVGGPFGSNLKVSDYRTVGVPILRLQNIGFGHFVEKDVKFITQEKANELSYHSFKTGDIVLAKLGDPIGSACIVPGHLGDGIVVADVVRIRNENPMLLNEYLMYALNSLPVLIQLRMQVRGSTRPRVNLHEVRKLRIPIPPLSVQLATINFLNRKIALIDCLIKKKEQQIRLLREKSTSTINDAVTKGLYPGVRMKQSGIEWLEEIPEHWGAKRLKYLASVNDDILLETTDPDFQLLYVDISSLDAEKGIVNKEPMTFESAPSRARRKVKSGDVIISTVRTYLRAIAPIVNPEPNLVVSTGFAVIRPKDEMDSHFAAYALRAPYFVDVVVANSVGVSYPAINASEMMCLAIAVPPSLDEQHAIAAFLDRETARIDSLIVRINKSVDLLREYWSTLVTFAAIGGIDTHQEVP